MKRGKIQKQQHAGKKNPATVADTAVPEKWKYYGVLTIIVLITFICYLPVIHNNQFVWDDDGYIKNNPLIQSFDLKGIFSRNVMGNYHPLTMLVFATEYQFFGLNATSYHVFNLLLHLLNVILVFYAVYLLSGKAGAAMVAALLFGIHPMHAESVAWASGLKDLLYTFFFLSSFIFYLKYQSTLQWKFYALTFLFFFLSLLSKAMAAPLPVLLLLTDYFKGGKINLRILSEKIPFFLIAIIFGVVSVIAQKSTGAVLDTVFSFPQRIAFACYGLITYIIRLVLPLNLCAYYPYPVKIGVTIPFIYYSYILFTALLAVFVYYSLRWSKKILFGFGFFTITIFLVLQLFPVGSAIMADRYSYLSSIGIFYLAGFGFVFLWGKKQRILTIGVIIAFTLFYSVKTYSRCSVWENNLTLWDDVINQYQNIPVAYLNRGTALGKEKRLDKAIDDFNKAIKLNPKYGKAYYNRAIVFLDKGKLELAIEDFNKAIELNPGYIQAYFKRGNTFMDIHNYEKALKDFSKVIELDPNDAKAYNNRGNIYGNLGKYDMAKEDLDNAIKLNPNDSEAYYNRGILFMNLQKFDLALIEFDKTIELNPKDTEAYINKGNVFSLLKRYDEAIDNYSKAIKINSNDALAYYYRGLAAFYADRKEAAIQDLRQAASLGNKLAVDLLALITTK